MIIEDRPDRGSGDYPKSEAIGGFLVEGVDLQRDTRIHSFLLGLGHACRDKSDLVAHNPFDRIRFESLTADWAAGVFSNECIKGLAKVSYRSASEYAETVLIVDNAWRRRGIGSALIRAAVARAVEQKKLALRMSCSRSNWPMRYFFNKCGARLNLAFDEIVADIRFERGPS
jgi:GNAT superfamily N-acetyltransferase